MRTVAVPAIASSLLLVACSGGGTLDEQESQEAWDSTSQALSSGESRAEGESAGESSSSETDDSADGSATADVDYACPEGGSALFDGDLEYNDRETSSGETHTSLEFTFSVDFQECGSDGVVVDGPLDYSLAFVDNDGSGGLKYTYTGDLVYSGDVEGRCEIDMSRSTTYDFTGDSGSYSSEGSYSGTLCGRDAEEVLEEDDEDI